MHDRPIDRTPTAPARPAQPARPRAGGSNRVLDLQRSAGNRAVAAVVAQRAIVPEDLAGGLTGTRLSLTQDVTAGSATLTAGQRVVVVTWDNAAATVRVRVPTPYANAGTQADVPKKLLRSANAAVAGVDQYGAGVDSVVQDFERGERALAAERARADGGRAKEIARLELLQANRQRLLNRRLIQSTMLNRFDQSIKTWVDHYNTTFKFTDAKGPHQALDPNLVKAMMYQESRMGTAGVHLEDPAESAPKVKTRQNIGQMIDSSGAALLLVIGEEKPALLAKHKIEKLAADANQPGRGESFIWGTPGFTAALTEYFADVAPGAPEKNVDYDFWVHAAVRWLFHKRKSVKSWEAAVRAYNGGGPRADHYRDAVVKRAGAAAGSRSGTPFVPDSL